MDDLISRLSEIRSKYNCFDETEEPYYRALSTAIKKLSEQADGDTISRQAAIDAIDVLCQEHRYKIPGKRETYSQYNEAWQDALDRAEGAIGNLPSAQAEPQWIPCSERLPEEDYWLGGSGRQFSDEVLVSVENHDDEDMWVYISQTVDGEWQLELPRHCEIIAWMPLPEPYKERREG